MSRSGDEMMLELSGLLNTNTVKTAAKKDDKKNSQSVKKESKKSSSILHILKGLSKLASELDEAGAVTAANLVDDTIKALSGKDDFLGKTPEELKNMDWRPTEMIPVEGKEFSDEQLAGMGLTRDQLGQRYEIHKIPDIPQEQIDKLKPLVKPLVEERGKEFYEMGGGGAGKLDREKVSEFADELGLMFEKGEATEPSTPEAIMQRLLDFAGERGLNLADLQRVFFTLSNR